LKVTRIKPGPGQESVWDYPRPPRCEITERHVVVEVGGVVLADTGAAARVLETSHPPVFYVPPNDIRMQHLEPSLRRSFCEWKGVAGYYHVRVGERWIEDAGWFYPQPTAAFAAIRDYVAFYPGRMDACFVDGERVQAQAGDFYGGWITREILGPFKGAAGTLFW
jgi:uncharacterized protein (DUF427 family)